MTRCGMAAGVKLIIMSEFTQVIANPDFSISSRVNRDEAISPVIYFNNSKIASLEDLLAMTILICATAYIFPNS